MRKKSAALRLKTAEERLYGKEPSAGDPFELFSAEDLVDGFNQILRSVMLNLDDAFRKRNLNREQIRSALKELKKATEKAAGDLDRLKKLAQEEQKEKLWDLVTRAIEINGAALEGAETGLTSLGPGAGSRDKKGKD